MVMALMVGGSEEIAVVVVVKLWSLLRIRIRLLGQRIPNPVQDPEGRKANTAIKKRLK